MYARSVTSESPSGEMPPVTGDLLEAESSIAPIACPVPVKGILPLIRLVFPSVTLIL